MLRLLIADDEKNARDKMSHCIDRLQNGLTIIGSTSDGYETYNKILELQPDIVLIDIEMPGLTGLEVIRKVRDAELPTVFIIISSYSEFAYAQEAIRLNVEEYLLKPFLPADVCRAVYKAAEHIQSVNMLPLLPGVLPTPENQTVSFSDRMKSPIVYPFELERELLHILQLENNLDEINACLNSFISFVHKDNSDETARMNCYVILYVELHRFVMSLGGDFASLKSSLNKNVSSPIYETENTLRRLCYEIHDRLVNKKSTGTIISTAVKYIEEYYAKNISLDEVANYIGVSPSYLSSQFSQILHLHFTDYIHKIRIHHAMELIKNQPYLKGYEIGELVGYKSFKYFSQSFRKVTGLTISQYRQQIDTQ